MKQYCFILMPFGKKSDSKGNIIDFDYIYNNIIKPSVTNAQLNPIRADEEITSGIIHKPMFERLLLCDYAIADLTTANANVFYELGIRHGIRPHSTILIFAEGIRLPFDVSYLRALPYKLDNYGNPLEENVFKDNIFKYLQECRNPKVDSPVYQLVENMPRMDIARLKTDTFRDYVEYSKIIKDKLKIARSDGPSALKQIQKELEPVRDTDPAILIDLFLSYRAVKDWGAMVTLTCKMPPILAHTVMVREQLAFAYNRLGNHSKAENILKNLINKHGASSETNGILGRVYKDLWMKTLEKERNILKAKGFLKKSIDCYLEGFEADWRDAYPGINAVTLMEMTDPIDIRQKSLIPVVQYAVERRIASKNTDYWDLASLLELSILSRNKEQANTALSEALTVIREKWEPETTANNINMIIDIRRTRGETVEWIEEIKKELDKATISI